MGGKKDVENNDKDQILLEVLLYIVDRAHYSYVDIDDQYSEKVFDSYIETLDGQKRYFTQEDIDEFSEFKTRLDDQFRRSEIHFFNLTYERLEKRKKEVEEIFKKLIASPIDIDKKGEINLDYKKIDFPKNKKELEKRWADIIRLSVISNMMTKEKEEENKKKKDEKYKAKDLETIKKEAIEATKNTFEDMFFYMKDLSREEWLGMYASTFVEVIDPHSSYLVPENKERFNKDMAGKFEGIGAQLQKKIDGVKIVNIIVGGPVWKDKLLEEGDIITKVANDGKPAVDVVGMRLDNVVKMIKGPKGTTVTLTVKKVDGSIKEVSIKRDVVEIEETFAKSALIQGKKHKYGIINLPKFYTDFENPKGRSSYSDMVAEIEKIKNENAEAIILDLRNNGGGSLRDVIKIAGLFIEKGPVVQVKDRNNNVEVLQDKDRKVQWDKPLIILVNSFSASASEILSAAMQDYKRAIIVGSKSTYGKGTVQQMVDLNQVITKNTYGDFGGLMLTIQKYYRINGGSTQLKGVESDIVIPDKYKYLEVGEAELKYPLQWDKIEPAKYETIGMKNAQKAIENSRERIAKNKNFELIDQYAKWVKAQSDENTYPLDYLSYKAQIKKDEENGAKFKSLNDYTSGLIKVISLKEDEKNIKENDDLKLRRDRWHESMTKDLTIEETVLVLDDLLEN